MSLLFHAAVQFCAEESTNPSSNTPYLEQDGWNYAMSQILAENMGISEVFENSYRPFLLQFLYKKDKDAKSILNSIGF